MPLSETSAANPAALRSPGTIEDSTNGHEQKAGATFRPLTPSSITSLEAGRGHWPRPRRGGARAQRPVGALGPRAAGVARGGVGLMQLRSGPALVGYRGLPSCAVLFVHVTRSSLAAFRATGVGMRAGWAGGDDGVTGNFGRLSGKWPGRGVISRGGLEGNSDRQPERNSESGGGGVIKMLSVPAGCWMIPGADISGNGSCFGTADTPPTTTTSKQAFFTLQMSHLSPLHFVASIGTLIPLEWFSTSPMDS